MKTVCSIFCFLLCYGLQGQRFGGDPPSLQWLQINNDAARVIFPAGTDSSAARVAAIAGALSQSTLPTIGNRHNKINIVLRPYTVVSNGYVALGPFRSEFYLTPPQNSFALGSLLWQDMLAIHEYRHVQQYTNFNVGLSHVFRILFGQQGQELANSLSVPNWFWEGDAVFQETLVSRQGRGRLPFFFNDYRALWLAGKSYSYMKLRNGSLRDFTPDHYRLGYMLVAFGREKYGDDFWRNVTHDAASFKGIFYPFQHAVRTYSGKSFPVFTKDAFDYFRNRTAPVLQAPAQHRHFAADQEYPAYADSNRIIYVKTSYRQPASFIEKSGQSESIIRVRDVSVDNQFSYRRGKIVYASYRPAARWAWNDYNELQVLDLASGRQQTITRRSKYFSPDISEDGRTIVAVSVQPGRQSVLHILDAANGQVLQAIPNPDSLFYTYPHFAGNEQVVAAVRKPSGRMALASINIPTGKTEYLAETGWQVLGHPVVQQDTIYFTAANGEYDQLFACIASSKKIYRVDLPAKGIGIYQPAVKGSRIAFTSFTAEGYRLQEISQQDAVWTAVSDSMWTGAAPGFGIHLDRGPSAGLLYKIPLPAHAAVKKYARTSQLFNFHSLLPYIADPDYTLSLVGNNVLNTLQSEIYGSYNRNEHYQQIGINETYGGLFPYIRLGANYIFNRRDFAGAGRTIFWNEAQANAGLSIPLNLSKGRSLVSLVPGADYVYKNLSFTGVYKDSLGSAQLGYINAYLQFTHRLQQARQQIYPQLAQTLYINYRNAISSVAARQFLASGAFYFPGFALTHSIVLNLAYQERDTLNQYRYSNSFPFSRGYQVPNLRRMYKWGINYHLPLLYPDWGIAQAVYFLRVRANLFYDDTRGIVAYGNGYRINTPFRSAGTEIFFDTKWWNELPVNFGFRYSRLLNADLFGGTGIHRFEFILPVNLIQR